MEHAMTDTPTIPLPAKRPGFDITSRYMREHVDVAIMDTLVDKTVDTGMSIHLKSSQSAEVFAATVTWRTTNEPKDEDGTLTSEQVVNLWLEQCIAATSAWDGINDGETPIECTPENVRALYTNPQAQWIYQQVLAVLLDDSRFFVKPRSN
jgi:hypothetical protein